MYAGKKLDSELHVFYPEKPRGIRGDDIRSHEYVRCYVGKIWMKIVIKTEMLLGYGG